MAKIQNVKAQKGILHHSAAASASPACLRRDSDDESPFSAITYLDDEFPSDAESLQAEFYNGATSVASESESVTAQDFVLFPSSPAHHGYDLYTIDAYRHTELPALGTIKSDSYMRVLLYEIK